MVIGICIGLLLGAVGVYLVLSPKLKQHNQINREIEEKNKELKEENKTLSDEQNALNIAYQMLIARKEELSDSIERAEKSAQALYQKSYDLEKANFESKKEKLENEITTWKEEAQNSYLEMLKECAEVYQNDAEAKSKELEKLNIKLEEMRSAVEASVNASKRAAEMEDKNSFYRLNISEDDAKEIAKLREVLPFLRDKEPLNKVIYKVYYEKPYTDLIGRVVGSTPKTGIYKITNIQNNMCYVGQAANIADRWKQHIKRGVGAEPPTHNKLYPAMYKIGVENFTFELIEECERSRLNEREDFWQDYFKAKEFGYSIK